MNLSWLRTIIPGFLLGFTISRLGFTDFNELHEMLLFRDLRLLFAFATAVSLTILLFLLLRSPLRFAPIQFHSGIIPGAILFGIGWAITGACPGVALAQVGQGLWLAWVSLAGIFVGIWLESRLFPEPPTGSGC